MKLKQLKANQTEVEIRTTPKPLADFETTVTVFFSYQTPVACHVEGVGYFKTSKKWSVTTSRHINQWLRANDASYTTEVSQETLDGLVL